MTGGRPEVKMTMPMRAARIAVAAVVASVVAGTAIAAYRPQDDRTESIVDKDTLTIGVKDDQPGLGIRTPAGRYEGFDVDVAKYVAGQLGVDEGEITWVPTPSSERDRALREGRVDMVFATYSITPERKEMFTFAGPYYVAHQDILVHKNDSSIQNVRDLAGKRLCRAAGSYSTKRVTDERGVQAITVDAPSYSECVNKLTHDEVDAVSTDDLILAGFALENPLLTKMVNAPFTDERYGVGIRKGDLKGCEKVNDILTEMYQNGVAETLLREWFGSVGITITTTVPQFEGCS
jgi:glutamate transport system substrate-binding protein